MSSRIIVIGAACFATSLTATPSASAPFVFDNGLLNGSMAAASRPSSPAGVEIEAADDFLLTNRTLINSASFTGLIPLGSPLSNISDVRVEIYRVFPKDSNTARTPDVPTRTNSPSDNALTDASAGVNTLSFAAALLNPLFTALNSVRNGINPSPNQQTGGEGPVTGQEVRFNVTFANPLDLEADHYFFIPQVALTSGDFFWLSSVRPIVPPGTPFAPDLQAWIRDDDLAPDWLRIGTDIVGGSPAPTFNLAFSLAGVTLVPEPASWALVLLGLAALWPLRARRC